MAETFAAAFARRRYTGRLVTDAERAASIVVSGLKDRAAPDRVVKWASQAVAALDLPGLRVEFRGA